MMSTNIDEKLYKHNDIVTSLIGYFGEYISKNTYKTVIKERLDNRIETIYKICENNALNGHKFDNNFYYDKGIDQLFNIIMYPSNISYIRSSRNMRKPDIFDFQIDTDHDTMYVVINNYIKSKIIHRILKEYLIDDIISIIQKYSVISYTKILNE